MENTWWCRWAICLHKGQHLTEGGADPHEVLEILGPSAVQDYLISEIQKSYRLQGVVIDDKHIEVIISQMLKKIGLRIQAIRTSSGVSRWIVTAL